MTNDSLDKLIEALNSTVTDKTLSLEAIKGLEKIKKDLDKALTDVETYKKIAGERALEIDKANKRISALEKLLEESVKKVELLERDAEKVSEALFTSKYAELRRQDLFQLVETVFRSPVFSRTYSAHQDVPWKDQYGNESTRTVYSSGSEITKEKTDKYR